MAPPRPPPRAGLPLLLVLPDPRAPPAHPKRRPPPLRAAPSPLPPLPPQTENAFQKQAMVSLGYKKLALARKNPKKSGSLQKAGLRWTRSVGLGVKTPKEAETVRWDAPVWRRWRCHPSLVKSPPPP
jgi:hypothetical protein